MLNVSSNFLIFLESKFLKRYGPKVRANYLWFFHGWWSQEDPRMPRDRDTSVLEVSKADQCAEDEKVESWFLSHMDWSPVHILLNMDLLI